MIKVYNININNVVIRVNIMEVTMVEVNTLFDKAIRETAFLENQEVFLDDDLFKGYEWNRIPRNDRLLLELFF